MLLKKIVTFFLFVVIVSCSKDESLSELDNGNKEESHEMMMFSELSFPPIYPGCEDVEDKKACFNNNIRSFFAKNFNTSVLDGTDIRGVNRFVGTFVIDVNGDVKNVSVKDAPPVLEKETLRVLNLLPKMIPGMSKGKSVNLLYSLPIVIDSE